MVGESVRDVLLGAAGLLYLFPAPMFPSGQYNAWDRLLPLAIVANAPEQGRFELTDGNLGISGSRTATGLRRATREFFDRLLASDPRLQTQVAPLGEW